jgi:hypothetical protein
VSNRPSHPPGRRARLAVLDMSVVRPMTAPPATATQQTSTSASMSVIGAAALPGPTAGRPTPSGLQPAPSSWLASVATAGRRSPFRLPTGALAGLRGHGWLAGSVGR